MTAQITTNTQNSETPQPQLQKPKKKQIKDNYYSVVEELAKLHGESTVEFCQGLLEFAIKDIAVNDPEHIGKIKCQAWEKVLEA